MSGMTPRFLAQAIGWVEVPPTEMGMGDRNGRSKCGVGREDQIRSSILDMLNLRYA